MKDYARIQNGLVMEIIAAYATTDADRPKAPDIEDGAEPSAEQLEQLRLHTQFMPGEVSIDLRFTPEIVETLVEIPAGMTVQQGDSCDGSSFGPPPQPPAPTASDVLAQRDSLLGLATLRIAPLQDAVDLDEATAADLVLLKAWKRFRVDLSRVEQQPGFPGAVQWPGQPA